MECVLCYLNKDKGTEKLLKLLYDYAVLFIIQQKFIWTQITRGVEKFFHKYAHWLALNETLPFKLFEALETFNKCLLCQETSILRERRQKNSVDCQTIFENIITIEELRETLKTLKKKRCVIIDC